jgi:hypothetical protein
MRAWVRAFLRSCVRPTRALLCKRRRKERASCPPDLTCVTAGWVCVSVCRCTPSATGPSMWVPSETARCTVWGLGFRVWGLGFRPSETARCTLWSSTSPARQPPSLPGPAHEKRPGIHAKRPCPLMRAPVHRVRVVRGSHRQQVHRRLEGWQTARPGYAVSAHVCCPLLSVHARVSPAAPRASPRGLCAKNGIKQLHRMSGGRVARCHRRVRNHGRRALFRRIRLGATAWKRQLPI